ncbi:MAG: helix-hairpin-helix domain-containing protein [Chthoniobacteraceae bacterium]
MLLHRFFALLSIFLLLPGCAPADETTRWEQWERCTFAADRYFDGDSFHVKHGSAVQVLRLYSADAPETDAGYAARVAEQAAYFGVTKAEVLQAGGAAKEFTARFLATPFRVITRRKIAPGASRSERFYAIVEREGQRLDAALIQAGLARATTESADFPDADAAHTRLAELRALEQKAAFDRKGLWAKSQRQDRKQTLTEKLKPLLTLRPGTLPAARKINLNTAAASDLEALPGIGPKTAAAIIRARPLRDFTALDAVPGIGPKKIEALRDLVSFQ